MHKWTSLACTAFLLMLCLTGLPLIFRDEIDDAIFGTIVAPPGEPTQPAASLDRIVAMARGLHPGEYVRVLSWEDSGNVVRLSIVPGADAPSANVHRLSFDARTGEVLGVPKLRRGFTSFVAGLHRDLLSGLTGAIVLGLMGLLFVASLVSGIVIYGPYMRRLAFGAVRSRRASSLSDLAENPRILDVYVDRERPNMAKVAFVCWHYSNSCSKSLSPTGC